MYSFGRLKRIVLDSNNVQLDTVNWVLNTLGRLLVWSELESIAVSLSEQCF